MLTAEQVEGFALTLRTQGLAKGADLLWDWAAILRCLSDDDVAVVPEWFPLLDKGWDEIANLPEEVQEWASVGWALKHLQGSASASSP